MGTIRMFLKQHIWVLYFAFVITLPLKASINNTAIIALAITWIVAFSVRDAYGSIRRSWIYGALLINFLILFLSLLYSGDVKNGFSDITRKLPLLAIPWLFLFITEDQKRNLLRLYVITWFIVTIYSLITTFLKIGIQFDHLAYFSWKLPETLGIASNYYALFIGAGVLVVLDDVSKKYIFPDRSYHIGLCLYLILFLAMLGSRNVFFVVFAAVSFKIIYDVFKKSRGWALVTIAGCVLSFLLVFIKFPYLKSKTLSIYELGIEKEPRYMEFVSGISVIREFPLFGVGIGDVDHHLNRYYQLYHFTEGLEKKYNVHNEYLYHGMAAGIPGLLSFLVFTILCIRASWLSGKFLPRAFCALFFLASLTEVILFRNKGIAFFAFFLSLLFITRTDEKSPAH